MGNKTIFIVKSVDDDFIHIQYITVTIYKEYEGRRDNDLVTWKSII